MRGVPQIEVTFDIDANGIVNVSAKDLGTGKEQHITITSGSNMTDDDIERAVAEAAKCEKEDKLKKEKLDIKNDVESLVFQLERALKDLDNKIDTNEKNDVEKLINNAKSIYEKDELTDSNVEELKSIKEKLLESFQKISEKVYSSNNIQSSSSDDSKQTDDVIDGDYKEI